MAENKKKNEALELEEAITKSEAFVLKYKKQLIGGISAVILLIAGILCYQNYYAQPREDKASAAMAKAEENFRNNEYELALNGNEGAAGFTQIMKDYSGTDAANLANAYAGLCYANLGKWQEAVKYLDEFSPEGDAMISPALLAALGNAYANTKNLDKAVETMKKAAAEADSEAKDGVNNSFSPTYLLRAADILLAQNKNDEALAIYQDIKKKYVNSMAYQEIDKYIERASQK